MEWITEAPPKPLDARTDTTLKIFTRAFSARDIAEPLLSFDTTKDAREARNILAKADNTWQGFGRRNNEGVRGAHDPQKMVRWVPVSGSFSPARCWIPRHH